MRTAVVVTVIALADHVALDVTPEETGHGDDDAPHGPNVARAVQEQGGVRRQEQVGDARKGGVVWGLRGQLDDVTDEVALDLMRRTLGPVGSVLHGWREQQGVS